LLRRLNPEKPHLHLTVSESGSRNVIAPRHHVMIGSLAYTLDSSLTVITLENPQLRLLTDR
jgi:hypothetical protein